MIRKKKSIPIGGIFAIAFLILAVLIGACVFLLVRGSSGGLKIETSENPGIRNTEQNLRETENSGQNQEQRTSFTRKEEFYNILCVGKDAAGANTDVMMLFSYDVANQSAAILQIPRDTYVESALNDGKKNKKLNSIYGYAYNKAGQEENLSGNDRIKYSMRALADTVEELFAVEIDRYVYVDLTAFRKIVDIIGGVTVTVAQDMDYDDPSQDLHIHLKAGTQTLKGSAAEGFVRFRSGYVEADLGREDAQKIFLSAAFKQILSAKNITRIPDLMASAYEYAVTDLNLSDITYLASKVPSLKLDRTYLFTAPGEAYRSSENGVWYYGLYRQDCLEMVNTYLNCYEQDITLELLGLVAREKTSSDGRTLADVKTVSDILENQITIPRNGK